MYENSPAVESVLDELTRRLLADSQSEPTDPALESTEDEPKDIERQLDELVAQVHGAFPADDIQFDEAMIRDNLEELLLVLIALHGETHGKELISALTSLFETQLSPGTVYPTLHELEDADVLSMHAKVRTKEYSIADEAYVRATVEQTMVQHLAFGLLLYAVLPRL
ncbi:PadR family transcriptional regulator [Natrinema altunense]|uniref:PadR family transcriptional regulator n=1 Tax=Natrinema altunense (strain JCM 12890 / CGMCC 1.3731 / AJ2) TaxID=1227494 RepID=L9ZFU3_NATA2|nr:helix-turn-helix transcriptional regulator [Natrinema altunense]ELY84033.1 PadR family transcriptional regulator [Natrinema altunense JCM 12890]